MRVENRIVGVEYTLCRVLGFRVYTHSALQERDGYRTHHLQEDIFNEIISHLQEDIFNEIIL